MVLFNKGKAEQFEAVVKAGGTAVAGEASAVRKTRASGPKPDGSVLRRSTLS